MLFDRLYRKIWFLLVFRKIRLLIYACGKLFNLTSGLLLLILLSNLAFSCAVNYFVVRVVGLIYLWIWSSILSEIRIIDRWKIRIVTRIREISKMMILLLIWHSPCTFCLVFMHTRGLVHILLLIFLTCGWYEGLIILS